MVAADGYGRQTSADGGGQQQTAADCVGSWTSETAADGGGLRRVAAERGDSTMKSCGGADGLVVA